MKGARVGRIESSPENKGESKETPKGGIRTPESKKE